MAFFENFRALFGRKSTPGEKSLAPNGSSGRLWKVRALAYRPGSRAPVLFNCEKLGTTAMMFRTPTAVKETECFEMELILSGEPSLRLTGQVKFVVSAGGAFRGQMDLWTTPPQQEAIVQYLTRAGTTRNRR